MLQNLRCTSAGTLVLWFAAVCCVFHYLVLLLHNPQRHLALEVNRHTTPHERRLGLVCEEQCFVLARILHVCVHIRICMFLNMRSVSTLSMKRSAMYLLASCMHMFVSACMWACACASVYVYVHLCENTDANVNRCMHAHAYASTDIACTYVYTYSCWCVRVRKFFKDIQIKISDAVKSDALFLPAVWIDFCAGTLCINVHVPTFTFVQMDTCIFIYVLHTISIYMNSRIVRLSTGQSCLYVCSIMSWPASCNACMYIYIWVRVHIRACIYIHTRTHARIRIHICMHVSRYMEMHTYKYTQTNHSSEK